MPCSGRPTPMGRRLTSRLAGGTAGILFVLTLLGCMNFAIGNRMCEGPDGLLSQDGEVHLAGKTEQDIYYPIPYANIPNLEITDVSKPQLVEIVDQKEDHFRIRSEVSFDINLHWRARGMRVGFLPPPPPQPLVKSAPSDLPAEPVATK